MKVKAVFAVTAVSLSLISNVVFAVGPHWTHEEQAVWGAIKDTRQSTAPLMYPYAECSIGQHQSPVDLAVESNAVQLNTLAMQYVKDKPDFFNSGHAIQVNTSTNYKGQLKIGNDLYPLIQYHFHAPSEHIVNKKVYPAELHFVHIREDGRIAVLGVLFKLGAANKTLQTILNNMPLNAATHHKSAVEIEPKSLLPGNVSRFYTYAGSLTTPPCSEGVSWYILSTPITLSTAQLGQLETLYSGNARLAQALNGRIVTGKIGK
jgi:carbonic anhydrase